MRIKPGRFREIKKGENTIAPESDISIEQYLEKVARFADSDYGQMVRNQFQDISGASELAMLAAPTQDELAELMRAVAIMTPDEKQNAHTLADDQVLKIAEDAKIDPANFAIFINGYAIHKKRPT